MKAHDQLLFSGKFSMELYRGRKLIRKLPFFNLVTNAAKLYAYGCIFNGVTESTNWYLGLIDNAGFSSASIVGTMTMSSHAGWVEWANIQEGVRQTWTKDAAANNGITATLPSIFTISATGTLAGGFLTNRSAIGDNSGLLWSAGTFGLPVPVQNGDQMRLNYQCAS